MGAGDDAALRGLPEHFGEVVSTQVGWTAGGGAEWMFLPNWSAKVEYCITISVG
jgi:outer membrane immunogenic protein